MADSSTARAVATKQGASRKMKHIHTRFLFIQGLVFRKLLTMSSNKTDVNPSDIGTKALDVNDFTDIGTEPSETSSPGSLARWKTSDTDELQAERMVNWTSRMIDTGEQA